MKNEIARLRILVVDDDTLSREVLSVLLEHVGYVVEAADSGDAAIQHLQLKSGPLPNVVLADIQMPGTVGRALALELRALCGPATKLLAMSGSIPKDETIQGFDGLLLKPLTMEELTAAIGPNGAAHKTSNQAITQDRMPLDETIYKKLESSMRRERLEQLYAMSLTDTEERIASMQKAASNKDDAAYRREAHAIKGSCGMIGAAELHGLAASIERIGLDDNHVASLDELTVACHRLRRILVARRGNEAKPHKGESAQ